MDGCGRFIGYRGPVFKKLGFKKLGFKIVELEGTGVLGLFGES